MKLVRLLLAAPILVVVACGGAPDAQAPSSVEQRDQEGVPVRAPKTIEEAEEQIAEAQAQLSPAPPPSPPKPSDDTKASQAQPTPATPAPSNGSSTAGPTGGVTAKTKDEPPVDACMSPCRAYASMRRAVEALCRMTGETDERCMRARRTLDASEGRVSACRCMR